MAAARCAKLSCSLGIGGSWRVAGHRLKVGGVCAAE